MKKIILGCILAVVVLAGACSHSGNEQVITATIQTTVTTEPTTITQATTTTTQSITTTEPTPTTQSEEATDAYCASSEIAMWNSRDILIVDINPVDSPIVVLYYLIYKPNLNILTRDDNNVPFHATLYYSPSVNFVAIKNSREYYITPVNCSIETMEYQSYGFKIRDTAITYSQRNSFSSANVSGIQIIDDIGIYEDRKPPSCFISIKCFNFVVDVSPKNLDVWATDGNGKCYSAGKANYVLEQFKGTSYERSSGWTSCLNTHDQCGATDASCTVSNEKCNSDVGLLQNEDYVCVPVDFRVNTNFIYVSMEMSS